MQPLPEPYHAPLITDAIVFRVCIKYKVLAVLIDRVVCQMHAQILEITFGGINVLVCAYPYKSVLVHKYAQRIESLIR